MIDARVLTRGTANREKLAAALDGLGIKDGEDFVVFRWDPQQQLRLTNETLTRQLLTEEDPIIEDIKREFNGVEVDLDATA